MNRAEDVKLMLDENCEILRSFDPVGLFQKGEVAKRYCRQFRRPTILALQRYYLFVVNSVEGNCTTLCGIRYRA